MVLVEHRTGRLTWLLVCLVASRGVAALQVAARDAVTGAPVAAQARILSTSALPAPALPAVQLAGALHELKLPAGRWRLHVAAPGYRETDTVVEPSTRHLVVLLQSVGEPLRFADLARRSAAAPGHAWLQGYVRRAVDGDPVEHARVRALGRIATTDAQGYFELDLGEPAQTPRALPQAFELQADAPGFPAYIRSGLVRVAGVQRLLIALGDDTPAAAAVPLGVRDRVGGVGANAGVAPAGIGESATPNAIPAPLAPPASIRVGYADGACTQPCCTGACSTVCSMPLETYVRRGLDSEWIASWNTQSLRAGSIAYRSYGVWRIAHPAAAGYDICSSACCQVNDAGTSASTDAAVARTPGILLSRDGSNVFEAEYSAQNNAWIDPGSSLPCSNADLSCGNGHVGSPAYGWPCLDDAVALNHSCFGHGRGMSQWGTQYWAIDTPARDWVWITDHYYNDNGNVSGGGTGLRSAMMTSPLNLSNVSVRSHAPQAGDTLRIAADAYNTAGAQHAHILFGASLYRSGTGYLDDASGDAPLSLAPGGNAVTRTFHIAPTAATGDYDLLVSLYLDVNEDGAVESTDLPLALTTLPAALTVIDDRIFADDFGLPD